MLRKQIRNTDPTATTKAKSLRKNMSNSERKLWRRIRNQALGFRVRRQYPVGPYFLDFFVHEAKLCIEVDGELHQDRMDRDLKRDKYLSGLGIETIRIRTIDLHENIFGVLERICERCTQRSGRVP
jgi:very-short-patch-repair endonuclease